MRVLVVHNRYQSKVPSGESQVVDDEVELLRGGGVEVDTYFRSSDEIDGFSLPQRLGLAIRPVYSAEAVRDLRAIIARARPDVIHLHNPFPLISLAIIRLAKQAGIPLVQTVHNYRHVCMNGLFFRDGKPCEDCLGRAAPWPGVVHGCYRGSRAQSVPMAAAVLAQRKMLGGVAQFLPLTEFMADHLRSIGVDADRITVRPNTVADPGQIVDPLGGFLYAGRLNLEKGIGLLLDAWSLAGLPGPLIVAGDGPERFRVEQSCLQLKTVEYLGPLSQDGVAVAMRRAAVVVVPSILYEGFPRVVVEAFSHGRAVVATAIGSLGTLVDDAVGWKSAPDPAALATALLAASDRSAAASRGRSARARYVEAFHPDQALESLLEVYRRVIGGIT